MDEDAAATGTSRADELKGVVEELLQLDVGHVGDGDAQVREALREGVVHLARDVEDVTDLVAMKGTQILSKLLRT